MYKKIYKLKPNIVLHQTTSSITPFILAKKKLKIVLHIRLFNFNSIIKS